MGSSKPASAAGAGGLPQPPAAVCCMCGDHGLLPELFRCAACSFRSQHTYCTDRYPQADSYGTCNWCLRADQGSGATSSSPRSTVKAAVRSAAHGDPTSSGGGGRSAEAKVAARRDFAANLNKPIKKQQQHQQRLLLRRSASDLGSRVRTDHDAPPSPGVGRGRPRIRRYKLLKELIMTSM